MEYRGDHFRGQLKDLRLCKRGELILKGMIESGSAVPHRLSEQHKERIGMSRFFHNSRASLEDIRQAITEQALKCIKAYKSRWGIEELFSLVKTKGLDAEDAQLESGMALKKLVLLALQAALHILQLIKDRDNSYSQPITTILGQEDIVFLEALIRSLEGKTEKQQNPHPPDCLARLAWAVARLGGWSGYSSQSPPGPKTMRWGWQRFLNTLRGWHLAAKTDSS